MITTSDAPSGDRATTATEGGARLTASLMPRDLEGLCASAAFNLLHDVHALPERQMGFATSALTRALVASLERFLRDLPPVVSVAGFGDSLADHLAGLGDQGTRYARALSQADAWHPGVSREGQLGEQILRMFGDALWHDQIRERVAAWWGNPAALSAGVDECMRALLAINQEGARQASSSLRVPVTSERPILIVSAEVADLMTLSTDLALLNTTTAHRLIRWLVRETHETFHVEGSVQPIEIDGGYSELACQIGCGSKRNVGELRSILDVLHAIDLASSPLERVFLLKREYRHAGRSGRLLLHVGQCLAPQFVQQLPKHVNRTLIPVFPMPPLIGRPNEHARQAAFQLRLVRFFAENALALQRDAQVTLRPEQLSRLAQNVLLPLELAPRLMERWCRDGADAPAVLERHGTYQYGIANAYARERDFIMAGGRRKLEGQKRGRKSAEARRKKFQPISP
jgi:hypothetical protein